MTSRLDRLRALHEEVLRLRAEAAKMRALVKELGHEGGATYVCGTFFNPPRLCDCEMARKKLLEMANKVAT